MNKRVLLIEDDRIVRENTKEILELASYDVITAENGKRGVALAKSQQPDIIICDVLMPELDGYGVLQIVSKLPELEHIPFIFLTAKTDHNSVRMGMELGADDYINKPFEESELLRAIESRFKRVEAFEHKVTLPEDPIHSESGKLSSIKNIDQFLAKKELFKYNKGETIYCVGNQSNHIFLIRKGRVKTYKISDLGKELITGFFTEEQLFGIASFIKHQPHNENSKAISPTQLYKINKDEIKSIINNNHHVLYDFIDLMAGTINDLKDQLILLTYGSVRQKTALTLLRLFKELPTNSKKELLVSRIDLASVVGIAKETLIRTLHDFKEEGLIVLREKSIRILDDKKLTKVQ